MNNIGKTLKISILGKSYTVVTDEHEADVYAAVCEIENLFKERGFDVSSSQGPNAQQVASIIALQIAIELVKAKKDIQRFEGTCAGLTGVIEQAL